MNTAARLTSLAIFAGLALGVPGLIPSREAMAQAAASAPATPEATLLQTPGGTCLREFLAMVSDGSPQAVRTFETKWASKGRLEAASIDERVGRIAELKLRWGVPKLVAVTPGEGAIAARIETNEGVLDVEPEFDASEPGKLVGMVIRGGGAPSASISPEARTALVRDVASAIADGYVYPEIGAKMRDLVLKNLESGAYDAIKDDAPLMRRLTDDLRSISKDKHLGVVLAPVEARVSEGDDGPSIEEMRRENFAFRKVERLAGNIGYLRFDMFSAHEEAKAIGAGAMNFLKNCDALIVDLRYNGGGDPDMIRFLTSYLFEEPTLLNCMIDRDGKVVEEYRTLEEVPGGRLRQDVPIYVLTSARTFSGAEEFSYNLQSLKRGTIVGETTGGGAHPVRGQRVSDRALVRIPYMRANNPITNTNWEGVGVKPDIAVPADKALDRAIEEARGAIRTRAGKER